VSIPFSGGQPGVVKSNLTHLPANLRKKSRIMGGSHPFLVPLYLSSCQTEKGKLDIIIFITITLAKHQRATMTSAVM
jgi:hypothetical protein